MLVSVKLIAALRKKLPEGTIGNTCQLELPAGSSVKDILEHFDIDDSHVVLVNGHSPDPDQVLQDGDKVSIFSAVAGG